MIEGLTIRAYRLEDAQVVRDIAFETSVVGSPPPGGFDDIRDLISEALTAPFIERGGGLCLIAEHEGKVVGTLIGSADEDRVKRYLLLRVAPRIIRKVIMRGVLFRPSYAGLFLRMSRALAGELFGRIDIPRRYPAVFHINIRSGYRRSGIGRLLLACFEDRLRKIGVGGVHCSTMSDDAALFFKSSGYDLLVSRRRDLLKPFTGRETPHYVFVKDLGVASGRHDGVEGSRQA